MKPGVLFGPVESDGRPVVVISPSTEGLVTWLTGAADNPNPTPPSSGRGEGTPIALKFTEPGTSTLDIQFNEPVELHDGELYYSPPTNWTVDDHFSFSAVLPATVVTPNGTNTGNCNLVDLGGYNLIVPAAGDGTHDVDLDVAVPVPTSKSQTGYWDVDCLIGVVTPGIPDTAEWNLLDIPLELGYINKIRMCSPSGIFEFNDYKVEWISERWLLRLSVTRVTEGAGDVGGWLMMFREYSV